MDLQEFIEAAHKAQHDAGSQQNFTSQVKKALEVCGDEGLEDPVAAFLASLIVSYNGDIEEAREGLGFWMSELTRVHDALKK